jgi:uncharacterized protein (DUF433 family)
MATAVDIGTLIVRTPNIRGGRPRIAGTGVTVQRIARSYRMGATPEEIVAELPHLTLAQVHAALTYYLANKEEIEADIASEDALYEELSRKHARRGV